MAPLYEANEAGEALIRTPPTAFPFVRRFGDVALVALSSAIPTMPFIAAGRLGSAQRAFLKLALEELSRAGLFRVVLIHHPPLPGQASWRRGLRDAKATIGILKEAGVELVLHGHNHEQTVFEFDTVTGPAVVVGFLRRRKPCSGASRPRATTSIASQEWAMGGLARWWGAPSPIVRPMSGNASGGSCAIREA